MNSNDSHKNKFKPWWSGYNFEFTMLILICIFMIALSIMAALLASKVHAEELPACMSIKAVLVDPRAIVRVVDGDTFHVFTFDVPNVVKIRVMDAETPERGEDGFEEAKAFTRDWLYRGPFRAVTCGQQTFDRIVYLITRDGETLADALKAAGHWRENH